MIIVIIISIMTRQRKMVLDIVSESDCHPTADMVYQEVRKIDSKVSLATVYRNLRQLAAIGMIREIEVPNLPDRFDKTLTNHSHLICIKCGKVFDFNPELIDVPNDFTIVDKNIVLKCICSSCKEKDK